MDNTKILCRLYYLACEIKPRLPDRKLLLVLPKTWQELINSAIDSGIGSGVTNYDQLQAMYMHGCESGIPPSEVEFKSLLANEITQFLDKSDFTFKYKLKLQSLLYNYLEGTANSIRHSICTFDKEPEPLSRFSTGFWPIDDVLSDPDEPGVISEVITLLGQSGAGKTYMATTMAAMWPHGSVWMFQPELDENLILHRVARMDSQWASGQAPILETGVYNPEVVLDRCIEDNDPNRLVIFDSLSYICGSGDNPENRAKWERYYHACVELKSYVKMVLITTHIKRGDSGKNIDSGAGSSAIEKNSGAQVLFEKLHALPNYKGTRCQFTATKNRMGPDNQVISFDYDYTTSKVGRKVDYGD